MPRVPESPGVTTLPQGDYGMVQYARPHVNTDFTNYGQAAGYTEQAIALQRDRLDRETKQRQQAAATDLVNQFANYGTDTLAGENGALLEMGVQTRPDANGVSFRDRWMRKIDAHGRELLTTVSDPEVRRLAIEGMSRVRRSFSARLSEHEGTQYRAWVNDTHKTAITSEGLNIANGTDVTGSWKRMNEHAREIASFNGMDWNDKNVRRVTQEGLRVEVGKAVAQAVDTWLSRGHPESAEAIIAEANRAGAINGDTLAVLSNKIGIYMDARDVKAGSASAVSAITSEVSPIGQGTTIVFTGLNPEEQTAWRDAFLEEGSYLRGAASEANANPLLVEDANRAAFNAAVTKYGSVEAAIIAVSFSGPKALADAEKKLSESGQSVTPEALRDLLSPEEREKQERLTKAYRTSLDAAQTTPTLGRFLDTVRKQHPEWSDEKIMRTAATAQKDYDTRTKFMDEFNRSAVESLIRDIDAGRQIDLSQYQLDNLSGRQRYLLELMVQRGVDPQASGDWELYRQLMDSPNTLSSLGETDALLLRAQLSPTQFYEVYSRRQQLLSGGVPEGQVNMEWLDRAVERYAMGNVEFQEKLHSTKDEDKLQISVLKSTLYNRIAALIRQTTTNKAPLSFDDYVNAAEASLGGIVGLQDNRFMADRWIRLSDLKGEEVPGSLRRSIAISIGKREDDIPESSWPYYVAQAAYGDLKFAPNAISTAERQRLIQLYTTANGRSPSEELLAQLYLADQLGNSLVKNGLTTGDPGRRAAPGTTTATRAPQIRSGTPLDNAYGMAGFDY